MFFYVTFVFKLKSHLTDSAYTLSITDHTPESTFNTKNMASQNINCTQVPRRNRMHQHPLYKMTARISFNLRIENVFL